MFLDSIGGQRLTELKHILLEVHAYIKKVNATCLHKLLTINPIPNLPRISKLEQPLSKKTTLWLGAFYHVGWYLWNFTLRNHGDIA